jgi:hypothetical protein
MQSFSIASSGNLKSGLESNKFLREVIEQLVGRGLFFKSGDDGQFLISLNHNEKVYKKFIKAGGASNRTILIRTEPISVFPKQYKNLILRKYGLVISPGNIDQDLPKFCWPYFPSRNPNSPSRTDPSFSTSLAHGTQANFHTLENWFSRSKFLVMIAANKVTPTRTSNYRMRRKIARQFTPPKMEIYGDLWGGPSLARLRHRMAVAWFTIKSGTLPNIFEIYGNFFVDYSATKGTIENKLEILAESQFSIVIENSNYTFSEKIFDAVLVGNIPIYYGPDLTPFGIPEEIMIKFDGQLESALNSIQNLTDSDIATILLLQRQFLKSIFFAENLEGEVVTSKICDRIFEYIEKKESKVL